MGAGHRVLSVGAGFNVLCLDCGKKGNACLEVPC